MAHLCKRLLTRSCCTRQQPSRFFLRAAYSSTHGVATVEEAAAPPLPQLPPFNFTPSPYTGPSADEILRKRRQHLNPGIILYYKKHINIVQGKLQYLYDEKGRRYLDAFAGIVTVSCGHCHPEVVDAIIKQTRLLQHTTTIYLNHAVTDFAEALAQKLPGNLKVVYFVNSGGEANDMALMMARLYTGNYDVIALRNAYHGLSAATMGLNGQRIYKHGIPQGFGIHHALNPNPYRGCYGSDGPKYAADVADMIETSTSGRLAGFFSETFQGVGGAVELAPDYLPLVYETVRKAGGLCIADEVQTAFGRLGSHYWGFETQGVIPDIVTMAKGLGNGLPVAAVVTTPEIASVLSHALHFNTFGGNPVCSAGGHAVLRVLEKEQRQQHCAEVGTYLLQRLHNLKDKHNRLKICKWLNTDIDS
ncbi:hypothetical protein L7F22_017079 [Adiantum nelumboides]|nr:hypothetical protein [Adiantum nelumboides]